jgi:hypothetical protein
MKSGKLKSKFDAAVNYSNDNDYEKYQFIIDSNTYINFNDLKKKYIDEN